LSHHARIPAAIIAEIEHAKKRMDQINYIQVEPQD